MKKLLTIVFVLATMVFTVPFAQAKDTASNSVNVETIQQQRNRQSRRVRQNRRYDRNRRDYRGYNRRVRTYYQTRTVWRGRRQYRETYRIKVFPNGRRQVKLVRRVRVYNRGYRRF